VGKNEALQQTLGASSVNVKNLIDVKFNKRNNITTLAIQESNEVTRVFRLKEIL